MNRRRRTGAEGGFTLVEAVLGILFISVVLIAMIDGLLTAVQSGNSTQNQSRYDAALTSMGEELKQIDYRTCADASWYDAAFQNSSGYVDPTKRVQTYGNLANLELRVLDVQYWSTGSFPESATAAPTTVPGKFGTSCNPSDDSGIQLIRYGVFDLSKQKELGDHPVRTAESTKRNGAAVGYVDSSPSTTTIPLGHNPPVARFTATPSSGNAPLSITFNGTTSTASAPATITGYSWSFDDGSSTPSGPFPVLGHTLTAGTFLVKLTVVDSAGVVASTTKTITAVGKPATPTGLHLIDAWCCTHAKFGWNTVYGVSEYQIHMEYCWFWNCNWAAWPTFDGSFTAPTNTGTITDFIALGSRYRVTIRTRAGSIWSDWSPPLDVTL